MNNLVKRAGFCSGGSLVRESVRGRWAAVVVPPARGLQCCLALCAVLALLGPQSVSAALKTYQFSGVIDYTDPSITLNQDNPPLSSILPMLSQGTSFSGSFTYNTLDAYESYPLTGKIDAPPAFLWEINALFAGLYPISYVAPDDGPQGSMLTLNDYGYRDVRLEFGQIGFFHTLSFEPSVTLRGIYIQAKFHTMPATLGDIDFDPSLLESMVLFVQVDSPEAHTMNEFRITSVSSVPEPSTLVLASFALAALGFFQVRRRCQMMHPAG